MEKINSLQSIKIKFSSHGCFCINMGQAWCFGKCQNLLGVKQFSHHYHCLFIYLYLCEESLRLMRGSTNWHACTGNKKKSLIYWSERKSMLHIDTEAAFTLFYFISHYWWSSITPLFSSLITAPELSLAHSMLLVYHFSLFMHVYMHLRQKIE